MNAKRIPLTAKWLLILAVVLALVTYIVVIKGKEYIHGKLIQAAKQGDLKLAKTALEWGADVNSKTDDIGTIIKYSGKMNQLPLGRILTNAKTDNGKTALIVAAEKGHLAVVKLLIKKGANVKAMNRSGLTALKAAASEGHATVAELLIEKGAEVNPMWDPPLMYAVSNGHAEMVRMLIDKGAEVNVGYGILCSSNWYSSRIYAMGSFVELGPVLVEWGPEFGSVWDPPLMNTDSHGDSEIISMLTKKGVDVYVKHDSGETALMEAVAAGHLEVVKILMAKGADVNAKTGKGKTALKFARYKGRKDIVDLLVAHGATE